MMATEGQREFEVFVQEYEARLRTALVLTYGPDLGREATAEALVHAWTTWPRVGRMDSPVAYLYRVGQSKSRKLRRGVPVTTFLEAATGRDPWCEPGLPSALDRLTDQQRLCTVLVCSYEWTYAEVAELTGSTKSTVQTHVERGLDKLRAGLEVEIAG
jgi:DNA-directed RNA polymerase specialized sigma24 family protein